MLPDRDRELLTAYVDGELSPRQRRHVAQLLERSEEARHLLGRLQEDSQLLRALPPPRLGEDLSGSVLKTIAQRRLRPGQPRACRATPFFSPWAGFGVAASLLLALGTTSYLYFSAALPSLPGPSTARHHPHATTLPADGGQEGAGMAAQEGHPPTPENKDEQPRLPDSPPGRRQVVKDPARQPVRPDPAANPEPDEGEPLLTDRPTDGFQIERVEVALPVAFGLIDLVQEGTRRKLAGQLGKDHSFRVELPCPDGTRALQRLQAALAAQKVDLVVEPLAQARLKQPQAKTSYEVYSDDLTAEDLSRLLQQVGVEERRGLIRRPPDVRFNGHVVVSPLSQRDRKEFSELLGVGPYRRQPGRAAEQAVALIGRAREGQGPPRPQAGKTSGSAGRRSALVLASAPVRSPIAPPEVKQFLAARRPDRPDTLVVLLVLRCPGT